MNQMVAILKYLGRQLGYYPTNTSSQKDLDEAYYIDWVIETYADFWNKKVYMNFFRKEVDDEKVK